MAIKASCTVTLSCYRDTQSVTRYYKLQSSTASAPSKPTTKPPSGWSDSEPSYTSGSTNTLYFCDLTVFSDGTWSYSTVSKSSSYEAAKEAYNKAVAAGNTANSANNKVDNLEIGGRNLIILGKCTEGCRISTEGSVFTTNDHMSSEYFKIKPSAKYTLTSYDTDTDPDTYISMAWYTEDKTFISRPTGAYGTSRLIKQTYQSPDNAYYCRVSFPISLKDKIKFEIGNKSTDYSKAPEDIASVEQVIDVNQKTEDIKSEVNSYKERLAEINVITEEIQNCISMLVTDGNGSSLMTQTEDGWTFNIDKINKSVNDISKGLDNLQNELGSTSNTINELSKAVANVSKISAYVKIRLEENKPCIELGTGDNNFKLLITNTDIRFMEGSSVPAYINNKSLYIKKAIVEEELEQGSFSWVLHGSGNLGLMWK